MNDCCSITIEFSPPWVSRLVSGGEQVGVQPYSSDRLWIDPPLIGEIFKANTQFANLVGVPIEMLRDGRVAIYEFMAEGTFWLPQLAPSKSLTQHHLESAGNYWEKFGAIAFDSRQKGVLASCILLRGAVGNKTGQTKVDPPLQCAFSFTIRRDSYGYVDAY